MKTKKVEILEKKRVFDDFFKIDAVRLKHETYDGGMSREMRRLNFERGDSVAALVWHRQKEELILIEQFRYPTLEKGPGWVTEVVAGVLKEDEDPAEAICREIEEEIGYRVCGPEHISTFFVSPGGTSERVILYYIEVDEGAKVSEGGGLATEHEDIRLLYRPWREVLEDMRDGTIMDAKTLIALMWFRERMEDK